MDSVGLDYKYEYEKQRDLICDIHQMLIEKSHDLDLSDNDFSKGYKVAHMELLIRLSGLRGDY